MRDPNTQIPKKVGGPRHAQRAEAQAPSAKPRSIPLELLETIGADGAPDLKALESRGLLPKYLRVWNNPSTLNQLKTLSKLLKADGVDPKNKSELKAWAEKHPDKLDPEASGKEPASQKPFKSEKSSVGRNAPCPCGSGKKFKKCCESK